MGDALSSVVAFAVGVAVSPFPIVAVVLVLFSRRARVNGPVFLVGWMVGLSVVVGVTFVLVDRLSLGDPGYATGVSWARVVLGVVLLVAAWRKWRADTEPDGDTGQPGWMAGIEGFSPLRVLRLSVVLAANPKNLVLAAAAGTALGELAPTTPEAAVGLGAFVVIGSAPVTAAVAYHAFGGERAAARLESTKAWLTVHHGAVLATLYLVFGALLISGGLGLR